MAIRLIRAAAQMERDGGNVMRCEALLSVLPMLKRARDPELLAEVKAGA